MEGELAACKTVGNIFQTNRSVLGGEPYRTHLSPSSTLSVAQSQGFGKDWCPGRVSEGEYSFPSALKNVNI